MCGFTEGKGSRKHFGALSRSSSIVLLHVAHGVAQRPEKQRTPTRRIFRQLGNFLSQSQVGLPKEGLINVAVDSVEQMFGKRGHQNLGFWTVL